MAYTVHAFATACQAARPSCTDPTSFPAVGGFYFQASNGSVALPVAGYDYNSDWTPLLMRLSLTGMAASLAAPELIGMVDAMRNCGNLSSTIRVFVLDHYRKNVASTVLHNYAGQSGRLSDQKAEPSI